MKNNLFKMGAELDTRISTIVTIIGAVVIIFIWYLVTTFGGISNTIFPRPQDVFTSFAELQSKYGLGQNTFYSIKLNFLGYLEAIAISVPLGFLIGLFPICRGLLSKWVDAIRFIPLTAVTGLFIGWFGIELGMKVHFLAFGILIYLLPIIVQRIDQVDKVHLQTAWTLGANNWRTFRHVYFPSVISKISDDIRVMVAISWTYIIVAELINKEGGVGALIFTATKQSRVDMVFAILILIIGIGYVQDLLFKYLDFILFPYKYESSQVKAKGFSLKKYIFIKNK
jgi:NitT/TauT family transport system permease protein